ncbi:Rhodanese-like domain-containing protein 4A, chloroplastic [Apostasia shenzhenica]|uniref:Rhodanese-like domain-containing protein 4A, chloroplastic n=1 Tax=Apostasia shenzhenica TaxID=1088818 RepID=A0A2I0AGQ9_9ASPA|nr:Rhodanese-like domain-containing protein 4A, chloroplastic [Apostasia shenzhenica]
MKTLQDRFILKPSPFLLIPPHLPFPPFLLSTGRSSSPPKSLPPPSPNPLKANHFTDFSKTHISDFLKTQLSNSPSHSALMAAASFPLPCFAAEAEQISPKINIESILISIDDFFNRYPYFVATLVFIWLVAIPLTQEYLNKYKFISAFDAFRKLRDDPSAQLLDIRQNRSVAYMRTPNLGIFNKSALRVEFVEGDEEGFVKEVLKNFADPGSTILCVLDNFDGNSLIVAELLFKKGFKEAYAIKGGLRGNDGWQEIQETLLPPSVRVYPRKKRKSINPDEENRKLSDEQNHNSSNAVTSITNLEMIKDVENGHIKSMESMLEEQESHQRPLSPYPNYTDLKPPSSPTPSKPGT